MTDENSEQPTPRPQGRRRAARRKRIILWGLVALVFIAVAFGARPIYRKIKWWRANQIAAEAENYAAQARVNDAASRYRAALQLDPLNYRALSGAARLATKANSPEAVDLWEQVLRLRECTVTDRQDYAALLLLMGRTPAAEKIISGLLKDAPETRTLELAVRFSKKTGKNAKALEFARTAVQRAPQDDAARYLLADVLATSTSLEHRTEARETLWLLATSEGRFKRAALESLARAPELTPDEQKRVVDALERHPNATPEQILLAADLRLRLQPADADKIYDQTTVRVGESEKVLELAHWLNAHQQPERTLALLPIERVRKNYPLLLARLDAMATLQRWDEIASLLTRSDVEIDSSVSESFLARTAQERNDAHEAELHWDRAISLAASDPMKLRFVAHFAEVSKANAAAIRAYEQLGKFPDHVGFALRGTQRLTEKTGEIGAQRAIAERIAAMAPEDPNSVAQLAYLNLLSSVDVEKNLEAMKALVAKYPERLSFRVAAALGYLRQHDAPAALKQFEGPAPIQWEKTLPSWRAVYAAVLLANEQIEPARKIIDITPVDQLKQEERDLIEPALKAR